MVCVVLIVTIPIPANVALRARGFAHNVICKRGSSAFQVYHLPVTTRRTITFMKPDQTARNALMEIAEDTSAAAILRAPALEMLRGVTDDALAERSEPLLANSNALIRENAMRERHQEQFNGRGDRI